MGSRSNFETLIGAMSAFDPENKESGLLWWGREVVESHGLGVDKINISLQTSIGVLRIEGASLDPPYIVSWNI